MSLMWMGHLKIPDFKFKHHYLPQAWFLDNFQKLHSFMYKIFWLQIPWHQDHIKINNVIAKATGQQEKIPQQTEHMFVVALILVKGPQSITSPSEGHGVYGQWYYKEYIIHVYWSFLLYLYNCLGKATSKINLYMYKYLLLYFCSVMISNWLHYTSIDCNNWFWVQHILQWGQHGFFCSKRSYDEQARCYDSEQQCIWWGWDEGKI